MLTQAYLKSILHYCSASGVFTWIKPKGGVKPGSIAGSINNDGYIEIGVNKKPYLSHRLAWLYMTGSLPSKNIDHKDGVRNNNTWSNLRECNQSQNGFNTGIQINNTSGFKGVSWDKSNGKWIAQARLRGEKKNLGRYFTPELANAAYQSFAKMNHGEFYKIPNDTYVRRTT